MNRLISNAAAIGASIGAWRTTSSLLHLLATPAIRAAEQKQAGRTLAMGRWIAAVNRPVSDAAAIGASNKDGANKQSYHAQKMHTRVLGHGHLYSTFLCKQRWMIYARE